MRLPFIAVAAVALAACGTDDPEDIVPGPHIVTALCAAGCNAGVHDSIVFGQWLGLGDNMFEFAGPLEPALPTSEDSNGSLDAPLDPCVAVAYTGGCGEACNVGAAAAQGVGGTCVAIACPTEVVIARCDP